MRTEVLADGTRRHTMSDGQVYEEGGPNYRLEYQSVFPEDTYTRDIAIFGSMNASTCLRDGATSTTRCAPMRSARLSDLR